MLSSNVALVATRNIEGHARHYAEAIRLQLSRQLAMKVELLHVPLLPSRLAYRWDE
jgi:hypothetical protein